MRNDNVRIIIFYNRAIQDAKESGNIKRACNLLLKLHQLEYKDGVKLGSYRVEV